jgi:hypothetical protein
VCFLTPPKKKLIKKMEGNLDFWRNVAIFFYCPSKFVGTSFMLLGNFRKLLSINPKSTLDSCCLLLILKKIQKKNPKKKKKKTIDEPSSFFVF